MVTISTTSHRVIVVTITRVNQRVVVTMRIVKGVIVAITTIITKVVRNNQWISKIQGKCMKKKKIEKFLLIIRSTVIIILKSKIEIFQKFLLDFINTAHHHFLYICSRQNIFIKKLNSINLHSSIFKILKSIVFIYRKLIVISKNITKILYVNYRFDNMKPTI